MAKQIKNVFSFFFLTWPGLLRAVGGELYNLDVESEVIDIEEISLKAGKVQEHVTFKVMLNDKPSSGRDTDSKSELGQAALNNDAPVVPFNPCFPDKVNITPEAFCQVFPYHILFDKDLIIKQTGVKIQQLCRPIRNGVSKLDEYFEVTHPHMPTTFMHIMGFIQAAYQLRLAIGSTDVTLKGRS